MTLAEYATDYGLLAQKAAEEHLDACYEAMWKAEEEDDFAVDSPASGPFCGCETCVVREVLHASYEFLILALQDEVIVPDRQKNMLYLPVTAELATGEWVGPVNIQISRDKNDGRLCEMVVQEIHD